MFDVVTIFEIKDDTIIAVNEVTNKTDAELDAIIHAFRLSGVEAFYSPVKDFTRYEELVDRVYVFYMWKGNICFDRSLGRCASGLERAQERIKYYRTNGRNAFYTIGTQLKSAYY